jgi:two-component system, cell cycle sensor histidine kinase PleC
MGNNWYLSHMHSIHPTNQLEGLIITHHNVTVWKQKEFALQQEKKETFESSQRKMFFLANLNHELKSPLNSIMGFSQLLKEQVLTNEHLEGYAGLIENISEGASHLNSIVFRILNMAKIESGTLLLQEERVTPAKLIQLSLNIIQPMFPNRNIQIEVCKEAAMETLKCDKNLAMEVLINLLVNSLKFSHDSVRVHCAMDDKRNLVFNVSDFGVGMTENEIRVALEPFGQNIRSPDDKNTGLGLGVPFCNQIMKLHGGDLRIQSEKGKGTTVSAIFPANRIMI